MASLDDPKFAYKKSEQGDTEWTIETAASGFPDTFNGDPGTEYEVKTKTWSPSAFITTGGINRPILLLIGGQSNSGTDPATGREDYANFPPYLQTTRSNIFAWTLASGFPTGFNQYIPDPSRQMGWIDYTCWKLAQLYQSVYWVKRGVGGTVLGSVGSPYPRADFKAKANDAIAAMDLEFGAGNYDIVMLWSQGESDALDATDAANYQTNLTNWFAEVRADVADVPIIFNRLGDLQVTDFPFVPTVQAAQDAVAALSPDNIIVDAGDLNLAELIARYTTETTVAFQDFSHFNVEGYLTIGEKYVQAITDLFARNNFGSTPNLLSAEITAANPNQIVLTYDRQLSEKINPRRTAFTITPFRTILENLQLTAGVDVQKIEVSGTNVTITVSEVFYSTDTVTLTYNKANNSASNIATELGIEADGFTGFAVTNNSTELFSSYSTIYAPDWSAGLDGWFGGANNTVTGGLTVGGESSVVSIEQTSSGLNQFTAPSNVTIVSGKKYIFSFEYYLEPTLGFKDFLQFLLNVAIPNPALAIQRTYQAERGNWVRLELEYISDRTTARPQIAISTMQVGDILYLRDLSIKEVVES